MVIGVGYFKDGRPIVYSLNDNHSKNIILNRSQQYLFLQNHSKSPKAKWNRMVRGVGYYKDPQRNPNSLFIKQCS